MRTSWAPFSEPGPRVTEDDVRRFEREFGYELPADYRAFLLEVNGGHAPRSHRVFTLRRGARQDESILRGLFSLNASDGQNDLASAPCSRFWRSTAARVLDVAQELQELGLLADSAHPRDLSRILWTTRGALATTSMPSAAVELEPHSVTSPARRRSQWRRWRYRPGPELAFDRNVDTGATGRRLAGCGSPIAGSRGRPVAAGGR